LIKLRRLYYNDVMVHFEHIRSCRLRECSVS